jgi:hypothetical protein
MQPEVAIKAVVNATALQIAFGIIRVPYARRRKGPLNGPAQRSPVT